jgi:hypothetical protein
MLLHIFHGFQSEQGIIIWMQVNFRELFLAR